MYEVAIIYFLRLIVLVGVFLSLTGSDPTPHRTVGQHRDNERCTDNGDRKESWEFVPNIIQESKSMFRKNCASMHFQSLLLKFIYRVFWGLHLVHLSVCHFGDLILVMLMLPGVYFKDILFIPLP
jgi:hypothetical protein